MFKKGGKGRSAKGKGKRGEAAGATGGTATGGGCQPWAILLNQGKGLRNGTSKRRKNPSRFNFEERVPLKGKKRKGAQDRPK